MLITTEKQIFETITKTRNYLLRRQHEQGYWVGILEADVSVVSGFIPLQRFLGITDEEFNRKAVNYLMKRQNDDGSWSTYFGGPGDINVTVQTYFGLKMCGIPASDQRLISAKTFILDHGGIEAANTYTKILIALFGQYSWKGLPEIPPELIYLPHWFFINIYECASWMRSTLMALSIILALKPCHNIAQGETIFELYLDPGKIANPDKFTAARFFSYENLILLFDRCFKLWDRLPVKIGRKKALRAVETWILQRQEDDGSWGGIMLPWLFSLVALKCLGYTNDHPVVKKGIAGLDCFLVEGKEEVMLQPAVSPVWDTAWTMKALYLSGLNPGNKALAKGAKWLLAKQIKTPGDWRIKNPQVEPGCWSFEFANKWYPDADDTAVVASVLHDIELKEYAQEKSSAIKKSLAWLLAMQNSDGSWAAFDRDNDNVVLKHIPYADFITPLDCGSPDITANVLSLLSKCGYGRHDKPVAGAIDYLKNAQNADGSWYGRWGVTYIYGTYKVLRALKCFEGCDDEVLPASSAGAAAWLRSIQNPDGGWGESCLSFELDSYQALKTSTASQTAWAILGLLSAGPVDDHITAGIAYLCKTQNSDGSWDEPFFTGGGFPKAFYLKYELYKIYYPLMALAKYAASGGKI